MQNFEQKINNEIDQKSGSREIDFNSIYKKSCSISAAVFLVANNINEDDNLKGQIKKLSLSLVSLSVSLKDSPLSVSKKIMTDIEKVCLELMSLFNIASVSGFIVEMNANILRNEFHAFIKVISDFSNNVEKMVSINNAFLPSSVFYNEFEKNNSDSIFEEGSEKTSQERKNIPLIDESKPVYLKTDSRKQKRKDIRRETIYEFIKRHNDSSIKDIIPHIVGCSEKTIQRELINLINEGKIKKIGERRWSKYSIV